VQVILDRILAQERRLQFSVVEEGISLTGKKHPKLPPKSKANRRREKAAFPKKKNRQVRKPKRR
jgi:ribonuclease R